ncbi:hypothetical protein [Larkinella terrae]|uniref:Uncharacterized protein n=1 Tax=Larkinella terrae TaxID=2025311 RepID=A0A7K0EM52_9BACT|nr:hypothetical protein [Larkinella terrae]MRS62917.1 hypothetical protein [Larkinella terrae]
MRMRSLFLPPNRFLPNLRMALPLLGNLILFLAGNRLNYPVIWLEGLIRQPVANRFLCDVYLSNPFYIRSDSPANSSLKPPRLNRRGEVENRSSEKEQRSSSIYRILKIA